MTNTKIRAIVFDYGNVLAGLAGTKAANNMVSVIGVPAEDYYRAYFTHNGAVNRGEIEWEELWKRVLTDLNKLDKLPKVMALNKAYRESLNHLDDKVIHLAERLKDHGYKIGVLSNTTRSGAENILKRLEPYKFDAVHCSALTGFVKPEPEAFKAVADDLGVQMTEMVFIDDSERSLSTADACGYTPILYTSYEALLSALAGLGVPTD